MEKKNNLYLTLSIILSVVVLLLGGFIVYDKAFKKNENTNQVEQSTSNCPKCTECEKCESTASKCDCPVYTNSSNLGEKVRNVKKIELDSTNQKIVIGSKTLNLKVDKYGNQDDVLYINNAVANSYKYDTNTVTLAPPVAYLTDKYVFFTSVGQDWDGIVYAIDENAKEIVVNDNGYQMHDFRIEDGYLHATGHVFRGLVDDNPDKDLLIKYIDNTLIVTEAK